MRTVCRLKEFFTKNHKAFLKKKLFRNLKRMSQALAFIKMLDRIKTNPKTAQSFLNLLNNGFPEKKRTGKHTKNTS